MFVYLLLVSVCPVQSLVFLPLATFLFACLNVISTLYGVNSSAANLNDLQTDDKR